AGDLRPSGIVLVRADRPDQAGGHVAKHGMSMGGVPAKLAAAYSMSHGDKQSEVRQLMRVRSMGWTREPSSPVSVPAGSDARTPPSASFRRNCEPSASHRADDARGREPC